MKQFLIALCLLGTTTLYAQNTTKGTNDPKALTVLNKASDNYTNAGGVLATFNISILSKGGTVRDKVSGKIQLKGSRFKIETNEMISWFDGVNQWVYLEQNGEVNLSKPSTKDLLMINPIHVFQLYKHGYNCKLLADKTINGKKAFQVELKPNSSEAVQNIVATFDNASYRPLSIDITNKDKSGSKITIVGYNAGQNYNDGIFKFNPKDYPNAEVIDLR